MVKLKFKLSQVKLSCLNKLSRVGGGGWLEKVGIRLSQLSTKLKLKLSLAKLSEIPVN